MIVFDTILVILAFAVLLMALARRFKLPYPVLLAYGGRSPCYARGAHAFQFLQTNHRLPTSAIMEV
jgi:hypothetical protein